MFVAQESKVVNILPPKDINSSAHPAAYVSMKNYDHVTFIVQTGATGAVGSSAAVSFKEAVNTSGSSAANLAINRYWKNLAALASSSTANDTYVETAVASSGNSFSLTASTDNGVYIVEIDAAQLNGTKDCVGVAVGAAAAATICGVTAILSNSRYKQASPPSAL